MFLVTTGDQRFWKKDESILFLGEWCKVYAQRHIWSRLDFEVLPYHWDDREQLHQDYEFLQDVNERYLPLLAERLNEIHQVDHSVRYWRIIIGYWLFYFTPILYDRYRSVCDAARSGKVTNTWITLPSEGGMTPADFEGFVEFMVSDDYNHHLYSQLIRTLGQIPFEAIEVESRRTVAKDNATNQGGIAFIAKRLLKAWEKKIPDAYNRVVFIQSCFDLRDLSRLQVALGQWPYVLPPRVATPQVTVNPSLRKRIASGQGRNEFELLLDSFIADQLPTAYVEGYDEMHRRSLDAFPKNPRMIATANAFAGNEGFKFWAAHQVEKGVKLGVVQHGGHYGSGLWSATEEHEIKISDYFYTWGWKTQGEKKTVPLPAGKLIKFHGTVKPDPQGGILWVQMSMPRYSYFMYSVPAGPQMLEYLAEQCRFLESALPAVRELLLARLYPEEYGWNEASRWNDINPTLKIYQGRRPIEEQLRKSRLVIATYNATTFLETLSANFPTVIFWNPKHWELRPSAQPYFDELRRVGILHHTPESAAETVNGIYQDVLTWWQDPKIHGVRDHFCRQFARTSRGWLAEWKKQLIETID